MRIAVPAGVNIIKRANNVHAISGPGGSVTLGSKGN